MVNSEHSFEHYSQNTETQNQLLTVDQSEIQKVKNTNDEESENKFKNKNLQEYLLGTNESSGEYEQIDLDEYQSEYVANKSDKNFSEQYKEIKDQEDLPSSVQNNNPFSDNQSLQIDQKQGEQGPEFKQIQEYDHMRKSINRHQDQKNSEQVHQNRLQSKGFNKNPQKHKVIGTPKKQGSPSANYNLVDQFPMKNNLQIFEIKKAKSSSQRQTAFIEQKNVMKSAKTKQNYMSKNLKAFQGQTIQQQEFENQIFEGEKIKENYKFQNRDLFEPAGSSFKQHPQLSKNQFTIEPFQNQNFPMTAQSSPRIQVEENKSTPHKVSSYKQNYIKSQNFHRKKVKSEKATKQNRDTINQLYYTNLNLPQHSNPFQLQMNNAMVKNSPYNINSSQKLLNKFFSVSLKESDQQKSSQILLNKFKLVKVLKKSKKRLTFPEIKKQHGDLL